MHQQELNIPQLAFDNLAQIGECWTWMTGVLGSIPTRGWIYFLLSQFNVNIAILCISKKTSHCHLFQCKGNTKPGIYTTHQRSCWKVMFSVVSFCHFHHSVHGGHVTITHGRLDASIKRHTHPAQTSPPPPPNACLTFTHCTGTAPPVIFKPFLF